MQTTLTSKGQVTIPKHIRDALNLVPGARVEFAVNVEGELVVRPAKAGRSQPKRDRFELVRGKADIKTTTAQLMKLLRD
jgi:antitoxin PrlF